MSMISVDVGVPSLQHLSLVTLIGRISLRAIWSFTRLLAAQALITGTLTSGSFALADFSDKALKKVVVDLGPSSYLPDSSSPHSVLTCIFFPNFMVKEIDNTWVKGTVLTAIVPMDRGAQPACTQSREPEEQYLDGEASSWWGFWGAKGNLLFFMGADGFNRGTQFLIYDFTTKRKVFKDFADLSYDPRWRKRNPEASAFGGLKVITFPDGQLSLRYRRVLSTDCDLRRIQEAACWQDIRAKLDLKTVQMPVCDYKGINPTQKHYASAIAYPVEVSLSPQPTTKTLSGPVGCWPVD